MVSLEFHLKQMAHMQRKLDAMAEREQCAAELLRDVPDNTEHESADDWKVKCDQWLKDASWSQQTPGKGIR
jgi:hypothetical protein